MISLSYEDAQWILSRITMPEAANMDLLRLQRHFVAALFDRNLQDSTYIVCQLVCRTLYLNYEDFYPETWQQIAAIYFLMSVYERGNNPFGGFIFDMINLDAYRTINRTSIDPHNEFPTRIQSRSIEPESIDSPSDTPELLAKFSALHKELMEELENHENLNENANLNPLSISLFTVENFPLLPVICKQVFYGLVVNRFGPDTYSLTPELLAVRMGAQKTIPVRSKFDGTLIVDMIRQREAVSDTWRSYRFPFCPIYIFENYFANRTTERNELLKMIVEDIGSNSNEIKPEIIRLPPPIAPIQSSDSGFVFPSMLDPLESMTPEKAPDNSVDRVLRNDLQKAITTHLYPNQTTQILERLKACEEIVFEIGLNPDEFMDLVENNPMIASEVIVIMVKTCTKENDEETSSPDPAAISFDQIGEYLMKLMSVDISIQSMEVINALSSRVVLPAEFMHQFITHSIKSCERIEDKAMQKRLARLNCVFLKSLITNKLIDVQDIHHEVETFCVEHFSIKEATALYKMLRSEVASSSDEKSEKGDKKDKMEEED